MTVGVLAPDEKDLRKLVFLLNQHSERLQSSTAAAVKTPVRTATAGSNITLSGLQTIDGIALAAGDRVLVKDQTLAATNGIYSVASGLWTRSVDANTSLQWASGMQVPVAAGTTLGGLVYRLTTADPIILGTTLLTFSQVSQFATPAQFATFFQSTLGTSPQLNQFDADSSLWTPVTGLFTALLRVIAARSGAIAGGNAILGASVQDMPGTVPANQSFPCGITAYGSLVSSGAGNTVFGLFGRADIAANGVAVNELDCDNSFADSPNIFPPDLSFSHGSGLFDNAYALGLQIVNIGAKKAHSGLRIVTSGGAPFLAGIYHDPPPSGALFGEFIDASASSSYKYSTYLRNTGGTGNIHLVLQTMAAAVGSNPVLIHQDKNGLVSFEVNQNGTIVSSSNATAQAALNTATVLTGVAADGAATTVSVDAYSNNSGAQLISPLLLFRAANGTAAVPQPLAAGSLMGSVQARPYVSGGFLGFTPTLIRFSYTDTTPGAAGCEIEFDVTPNGSTAVGSRLVAGKFLNSGGFAVGPAGTADPGVSSIAVAGVYKVAANQVVGARVAGSTAMTGTPDKATAYATSTVTLAQLAGRVMQLQADFTSHGLIGA